VHNDDAVAKVIRARTPPRGGDVDQHRQRLWALTRPGIEPMTVSAEIIAFTDGVELEILVSGRPRPRLRFLRDSTARSYAGRMQTKLLGRGFAAAAAVAVA
jgi:hypothetical protein